MASNYQRGPRDRRSQQPQWQREDEEWSGTQPDDDYRMGLGQESRGEDFGYRDQESTDRWSRRENMRRPQTNYLTFGDEPNQRHGGGAYRNRELDYGQDFGPSPYRDGRRDSWRSWPEPDRDSLRRNPGQFVGRGPRGYKRSDERIEEEINERLTQHGDVDATEIEVAVQNAEVTLRGSVDSRQAKRLAEDIADSVFGVKETNNQIRIRRQGGESGENRQEAASTGKQRKIG